MWQPLQNNRCCLKSIVLLTIFVHLFTYSSQRDASPSVRLFVTRDFTGSNGNDSFIKKRKGFGR